MCVEALCLSGPGSGETDFCFLLLTWPPSPQYGKENSCESVGIEMEGGSASAARAVPMLPVTPRCPRGPFTPGLQREEPGQGPRALKPTRSLLSGLLRLLFVLSLSCCSSLQAGERIRAWKALCKLGSGLGSALSGRDLGLGSWVFPNWRFLLSPWKW